MWQKFQLTAARRRLATSRFAIVKCAGVSTHSRPKAAGVLSDQSVVKDVVSTHSRPKAAGSKEFEAIGSRMVSTHSRPKAAGQTGLGEPASKRRFNSQPPEGGWFNSPLSPGAKVPFQLTAARRRLG